MNVPDSNCHSYRMQEKIPETKPEEPPAQNLFYDNTPIDMVESPTGNPKLSLIALNKFKRPKTT